MGRRWKRTTQSKEVRDGITAGFDAITKKETTQPEPDKQDQTDNRRFNNETYRTTKGTQMRIKYSGPKEVQISARTNRQKIYYLAIQHQKKIIFKIKEPKGTGEEGGRTASDTKLSRLPEKASWLEQIGEAEFEDHKETVEHYKSDIEDYFGIPRNSLAID